jgi:hypothetical protein
MFNKMAIRQILTECWNEVEPALDNYRLDNKGADFPSFNIGDLHVYIISWHTDTEWQETINDFDICEEHLNHESRKRAIDRLKNR